MNDSCFASVRQQTLEPYSSVLANCQCVGFDYCNSYNTLYSKKKKTTVNCLF